MSDRHMAIQDYLIHALAGLGEKEGLEDQELLWKSSDPEIRVEVVTARARHEHLRLNGLRAALADPRADVRERALELLLEGPYHPELADLVAHCLADDKSQEVRDQAFELVATLPPDERFVPGLAAYLGHQNKLIRHLARHLIRRAVSQNSALLRPVLQLLEHSDASTRNNALKALRYPNQAAEVMDALLKALDRAAPASKRNVGPALAHCTDRERLYAELRKRLYEGEEFETKVGAAWALAHSKLPSAKADLETLLRDANELYSCAAILGLEILGAQDMIHELRAMLGSGEVHDEKDADDYPDWGIPD